MNTKINHTYHLMIILMFTILVNFSFAQNDSTIIKNPDPKRFEKTISLFDQSDKKNTYPRNAVLFVGSSSIRLWETHTFFPDYPVINRGFGGSHISDVNYYFEPLVRRYSPKIIVFYAGDNDIAYEKSVEQVVVDFKSFVKAVETVLGEAKIIYIPIKPSWNRWQYWPEMKMVNMKIEEFAAIKENLDYVDLATPMFKHDGQPNASLFVNDSLHLNRKGYQLWTEILSPILEETYRSEKY